MLEVEHEVVVHSQPLLYFLRDRGGSDMFLVFNPYESIVMTSDISYLHKY